MHSILTTTSQRFDQLRRASFDCIGIDWKFAGFTYSFIDRLGGPQSFVPRYFARRAFNSEIHGTTINGEEVESSRNLHSMLIRCEILMTPRF